jgi:F0F1-type ATP synthase beta subunit
MKAFLSYLEKMNEVKQDQQIENVIIGMKETLREGDELWEKVKMKL